MDDVNINQSIRLLQ